MSIESIVREEGSFSFYIFFCPAMENNTKLYYNLIKVIIFQGVNLMGRFRPRGNPTQRMIGRAVSYGMREARRQNGYNNSSGCGCLTTIIVIIFIAIFLK